MKRDIKKINANMCINKGLVCPASVDVTTYDETRKFGTHVTSCHVLVDSTLTQSLS